MLMIGFKGSIYEPSRRSNDRVVFENKKKHATYGLASTMALVTANDWEENIDFNVPVAFSVSPFLISI